MANVSNLLKTKRGASKLTVAATDNVLDALKIMSDSQVGAVLVVENKKIVGIFTERDYLKKGELVGKCAKTTMVKELMTKDMYTVKMDTTIEQSMALMNEHHFRHLPVVEDGQMLGILSIRDVLNAVLTNKVREIMGLENYMTASNFLG
ncbi:MAG: CBS domain-containing protein [Spirochaetota bacterium]|nr:CBS domain-containing protein [Spirochaetota bacterium]